jgi:hypothetical protein
MAKFYDIRQNMLYKNAHKNHQAKGLVCFLAEDFA